MEKECTLACIFTDKNKTIMKLTNELVPCTLEDKELHWITMHSINKTKDQTQNSQAMSQVGTNWI